ncbi:MAG: MG2 domain-containing protein [Armatimonadota bacterium]
MLALALAVAQFTITIASEKPMGVVSGRVVSVKGPPIADALVVVHYFSGENVLSSRARTDQQGRFTIPAIPAGKCDVTAHCPGYSYAQLEEVEVHEGTNRPLLLKMVERPPELSIASTRHEFVAGRKPRLSVSGALRPPAEILFRLYKVDVRSHLLSPDGLTKLEAGPVPTEHPALQWSLQITSTDDDGNYYKSTRVPASQAGGYLLVASLGKVQRRFWLLLTPLGIAVKSAGGRALAYVTSLPEGRPIRGASVEAWRLGRRLWSGTTDTDGLAVWNGASLSSDVSTVFIATRGNDLAFAHSGRITKETYRCYLYTDRPVYRPGHVVHFRGILRQPLTGGYRTPVGVPVTVRVNDESDNTIKTVDLTTGEFGTFSGSADIPESANPGSYSINAVANGETYSFSFEVQEYRKPEYKVVVSFPAKHYLAGQTAEARVSAEYYFGAPVVGASVSYSVRKDPYWLWTPEDPEEAFFGDESEPTSEGGDWYPAGYGELVLEGEGVTDDSGYLMLRIPTERLDSPYLYVVEARVTDISDRTVTGISSVPVSPASIRVSVRPVRWLYALGERMSVKAKTSDLDGKAVGGVLVEIGADAVSWTDEKAQYRRVATASAVTDSRGSAVVTLPPLRRGSYRITALAKDAAGRVTKAETSLWVSDEEGIPGVWGSPYELELVKDKSVYRPGDTAKVLISSRAEGAYALVTLEGAELFDYWVAPLSQGGRVISVPLNRQHVPNVYLDVCVGYDEAFIQQEISLNVSPADQFLQVELKPDRTKYHPGDDITYKLVATDVAGHPVRAEFSLGVVDESVYAVRSETVTDIKRFFHGWAPNLVMTSTNMQEYYSAGADKMGDRTQVRRYFPDTAFWSPSVVTDEHGEAVISFTLPDSLTSWRATARGITLGTQVGSAVVNVICTKDLIVRPTLPRFFTQRDNLLIGSVVHNYSGTEQRVRVSVQASLLAGNMMPQMVNVPADGSARVQWRVTAPNPGTARLLFSAVGTSVSDAVELEVPVLPHGMEFSSAQAGELSGRHAFALHLPSDALPAPRELRIGLSPSVASAALGVMDCLKRYRYETAEGIMDVLLPDVVMSLALQRLGLSREEDRQRLERLVRHDLQTVYSLQHEDGGWGWSQYDATDGWMTAYVLYGLVRAREAGFNVDRQVFENAVNAAAVAASAETHPDRLSTIVYALSLAGSPPWKQIRALLARADKLENYSTALLILALDAAGDRQRARRLLPQLVRGAVESPTTCSWPELFPWGFYSCNEYETTAYALRALLRVDPNSRLVPKAARWLMLRRRGDRWSANYDTASVIYALAEYLTTIKQEAPSCTVQVRVNGHLVNSVAFSPDDVYKPEVVVSVPPDMLRLGQNTISLSREGTGSIFYWAQLRWYSGEENLRARGGPIGIKRTYARLLPHKQSDGTIKYVPRPLRGRVGPGDLLQVQIEITAPRSAQYLVVDDHIPSGCEPVGALEAERGSVAASEWTYWWSGQEFRDEKVRFYLRYVNKGKQLITYTMRPELAGEFHILPARVSGLYEPDLVSSTSEDRLMVLPRQ